MRDGIRLATDLYLPPKTPAPVIAIRTPYARDADHNGFVGALIAFARRGYVVASQDCRGTGASEPENWDYYLYEAEDGYDFVEWIRKQAWFWGFIGSCGGSYVGQTQWCMATHPAMSTIVPTVSGLGVASNTTRLYMFMNAYARSIGKGGDKVSVHYTEMERFFEKETMAGGFFNEPLKAPISEAVSARFPDLPSSDPSKAGRQIWASFCSMSGAQRAEFIKEVLGIKQFTATDADALSAIFGHGFSQDALTVPRATHRELCQSIEAPPLLRTGWYDWALNDALDTWVLLRRQAKDRISAGARMIIGPHAHNMPGYREGSEGHPELLRLPALMNSVGLVLHWYATVLKGATDDWPAVTYFLMGANEWRTASDWPVPEGKQAAYFLESKGRLTVVPPAGTSEPDSYTYDPLNPTPTVGGSIVSYVYTPGSVDVAAVQRRPDVLVYTTEPIESDLDVVGPLRMILYASSSAIDTDFSVRLSDVFPDGRAIQIQSGILRTRYRNKDRDPEPLEPGKAYRLEIDMWATANRFKTGHRLRIDISSADFPRFDRNTNRGGEPGMPVAAQQMIYHDSQHPSHLLVTILDSGQEEWSA